MDTPDIEYRVKLYRDPPFAKIEQRDRRAIGARFKPVASASGITPGEALMNAATSLRALELDIAAIDRNA